MDVTAGTPAVILEREDEALHGRDERIRGRRENFGEIEELQVQLRTAGLHT